MNPLHKELTSGTPARLSKTRKAATAFVAFAFVIGAVTAAAPAHADGTTSATTACPTQPRPAESTAAANLLLHRAAPFSILSGAAATIPASFISGDIGANAAVTLSNTVVSGISYASADCNVVDALSDAAAAYKTLKHLTPEGLPLTSDDLGGQTIHPGIHHQFAAITASSTVTFDGKNPDGKTDNPDSVFVIQTDAALNTTAGVTIVLEGGAKAENIYWVATGAATLGAGTNFSGTIISGMGAVTIGAGSTFTGRAISLTAAATLDSDTFGSLEGTGLTPHNAPVPPLVTVDPSTTQ